MVDYKWLLSPKQTLLDNFILKSYTILNVILIFFFFSLTHFRKKMNDQDKHEMRLLQELYLEDEFGGSEKRKRNFRWRNIDENFNRANNANTENRLNDEVDEADNYSELKERNLDLVERNKYLLEMEEVCLKMALFSVLSVGI